MTLPDSKLWHSLRVVFWGTIAFFLIAINHSGFRKKFFSMVMPRGLEMFEPKD